MNITLAGQNYSFADDQQIGSGGFFDVFRGTGTCGGLVVKILKRHLSGYAPGCEAGYSRQRLLNASGLFPKVDSFGKTEINGQNRFVVVEEYVTGKTLAESIGELDTDRCVRVFKKITYALHILHSEDIIHRDNHSGNILLDENDNVRILDFNTAISEGQGHSTKHSPGAVIWGPFRDPSAATHADFTKKSDIYSLGVVFAEQLLQKKASDLNSIPYSDNVELLRTVQNGMKTAGIQSYLIDLISAMIQAQPSRRPDTSAILQTLEVKEFRLKVGRLDRSDDRERSFGFVRLGADRLLEVFIRKRDISRLRLPTRALLQLMVLNPKPTQDQPTHMLLTPKRFIKSDKIIMFARVNLPNFFGVFNEFLRSIESTGSYRVFGFTATRGFRHQPGTLVQITIGQDKKLATDVASYLDPLARHLRSCIYDGVRMFLVGQGHGQENEWNEWAAANGYVSSVHVSATLAAAFHGRFVRRHYANGYLGSTEYVDHSYEKYAVIRDLRIASLVPDYFKSLKEGDFHPVRVVPDGEHRDLVIQLIESSTLTLFHLRTRCLTPVEESPNFIAKFIRALNTLLLGCGGRLSCNIETFEINDGEIGQIAGESLYSVRVSTHISCQPSVDIDFSTFRTTIEKGIQEHLAKINGRSIEVFFSPIFGDTEYCSRNQLLRFSA